MPSILIAATDTAFVTHRPLVAVIAEKVETLGAEMAIAERRCRQKGNVENRD
jgi:hypothetical protein